MLGALRTDNSPFDERQLEVLNRALADLDPSQSLWLSGYLAGLAQAAPGASALAATQPAAGETLNIYFGTETGNGEALAERLADTARAGGIAVETTSLDGLRLPQLAKVSSAVFIVSTHGEGDPPEEALDFFEALDGPRAPRLEALRYRVLALGDRSYTHFCAAGVALDERLADLGAERLGARVDCDVDYEPGFEAWATEVIAWSHDNLAAAESSEPRSAAHLSVVRSAPEWTRERPFEAEVLDLRPITGEGSGKDVRHLELSLAGSGLHYQPGDALGVWAPNAPDTVAEILTGLALDESAEVTVGDERLTLGEALSSRLELTRLDPGTISAYAEAAGNAQLAESFDALDTDSRTRFIEARQFADLVAEFPGRLDADTLANLLRPLAPRSYSIASSTDLVGEEVHLTVATLASDSGTRLRHGVASGHLNLALEPGQSVRVFPEPNTRFRLPDDDAPLVMIGAGTGIAPFRAFAQQLEADGRHNPAWLIFGNPHLRTDFLYQREWLKWRETGQVSRIDAAWSRDQDAKRYVQHVVAEQARRLDDWLQRGAHVYLCGALAMGKSVQDALAAGLAQARSLDEDGARESLADLRRAGRLHKDLY